VRKSPAVTQALKQYDPQKPETFLSVAGARLVAQADVGIEPENRVPITKDEALRKTAPIWGALPGQREGEVRKAAERFEKMFGPDFPEAFTYALSVHTEDQAVKKAAASAIRKWLKGQPVGPTEARQADQQTEVAATEAAVNAMAPERRGINVNPGRTMAQEMAAQPLPPETKPGAEAKPAPPSADIIALRRNPALEARFDEKYGKGAAKKILDAYPVGANNGSAFPPPMVP
jgi:hypothetical protein